MPKMCHDLIQNNRGIMSTILTAGLVFLSASSCLQLFTDYSYIMDLSTTKCIIICPVLTRGRAEAKSQSVKMNHNEMNLKYSSCYNFCGYLFQLRFLHGRNLVHFIIEIGLEHAPFVVWVYFFPHLNTKKPADYGPQQHSKLIIKV